MKRIIIGIVLLVILVSLPATTFALPLTQTDAPKDSEYVWAYDLSAYYRYDVNGDGAVDIEDLLCVIEEIFLETYSAWKALPADVNHDGIIDIEDLLDIVEAIFEGRPDVRPSLEWHRRISKRCLILVDGNIVDGSNIFLNEGQTAECIVDRSNNSYDLDAWMEAQKLIL